jgi:hypothetical protein
MAVKLSVAVRNARLDAFETAIGASAVLKFRTGAPPTNITDPDSGTVLCSITLPADWMAAAASGTKAKSGTWQSTGIGGGGTIGHFRLYQSDGTTQMMQGTVGQGSGDLSLDNTVIADGQTLTVNTFSLTDGNA